MEGHVFRMYDTNSDGIYHSRFCETISAQIVLYPYFTHVSILVRNRIILACKRYTQKNIAQIFAFFLLKSTPPLVSRGGRCLLFLNDAMF